MTELSGVAGRTVLVTGASKGIGATVVQALGAAGAYVIAHYGRDTEGVKAATADIPSERLLVLSADLADSNAIRRMWNEALAWRGTVDVLVNNAAMLRESPLDATDEEWDEVWDQHLAVNLKGPMALTRNAVRYFTGRGGGVLITLTSWVAQKGAANPHLIAYAASKAAIKAATQTLATAHAAEGLLTYLIAPGMVATQMSIDGAAKFGGEAAARAKLAMKEWVPPAEIAALVVFLASGKVRHLSGATIDVNGASYIR
jgi:NAD(P)-dependent dehydrogenase (short-subunit alcohol dehydrogenase family)